MAERRPAVPGQRPPIKLCPVCGITMQASKSDGGHTFDTFHCLRCDCLITSAPDDHHPDEPREQH